MAFFFPGALNAMNTVFNSSSAEDSFENFPSLARQIFASSNCTSRTILSNFRPLLQCLAGVLSDGQYDDRNLENILKSVLGQDRRIFDVGTTSGVCKRIAIITSQISDGKACVLANYRGVGIRSVQSAYRFLIPQAPDQNPFLWEVYVDSDSRQYRYAIQFFTFTDNETIVVPDAVSQHHGKRLETFQTDQSTNN